MSTSSTTQELSLNMGKIASTLLPPRRRKQIEKWLDEIAQYKSFQNCASGKLHGHFADLSTPSQQKMYADTPSAPITCPVCGLYSEGEEASAAELSPKQSRKSLFHSLKLAVLFSRTKKVGKSKTCDPAPSTNIWLACKVSSINDSGSDISSMSCASLHVGTEGGIAIIDTMARLKRAQKLLERSHLRDDQD